MIRRIRSLSVRDLRDVLCAQATLLREEWRLRREPLGALASRKAAGHSPVAGDPRRAHELARAVERASRYGLFSPYCLVRAMALRALLESHGISGATVRVGVRRCSGEFQAHAWVRWAGEVLGDRAEHVATFTEVDDLRILEGR